MVSSERRKEMITKAAYFRAHKRGFSGDEQLKDWLEAESEVDASLAASLPDETIDHKKYFEKLRAQVDDYGERLRKLRAKAKKIGADVRHELVDDLAELSTTRNELRKKLTELQHKSKQQQTEIKHHVEDLWAEIKQRVDKLASRLEK